MVVFITSVNSSTVMLPVSVRLTSQRSARSFLSLSQERSRTLLTYASMWMCMISLLVVLILTCALPARSQVTGMVPWFPPPKAPKVRRSLSAKMLPGTMSSSGKKCSGLHESRRTSAKSLTRMPVSLPIAMMLLYFPNDPGREGSKIVT